MDQTGFYLCMELNVNAFVQNREYPLLAMYIVTTNSGKKCVLHGWLLSQKSKWEIYTQLILVYEFKGSALRGCIDELKHLAKDL